jgi:hypothetical protein
MSTIRALKSILKRVRLQLGTTRAARIPNGWHEGLVICVISKAQKQACLPHTLDKKNYHAIVRYLRRKN